MSLFVDTSAIYSLLVGSEQSHPAVLEAFEGATRAGRALWTTSYVTVETGALLQHRIGMPAVRDFLLRIVPILNVEWVAESLHRRGATRLIKEDRRRLSLVDCISFELMNEKGITQALTLDRHFEEAGYEITPTARDPHRP